MSQWPRAGFDHRFGQHPPLHRYQPWQAGDCYDPNDDHGWRNLDCASQAPLHPGYAGYAGWDSNRTAVWMRRQFLAEMSMT